MHGILTIIRVHDGVNESIQQNGQIDVTVVVDVRVEPVKEEDGRVVVHVQETQLPPLFAQDNKDGVPKVPDFGNVKEPQEVRHGRMLRVVVVTGFENGVAVAVGQQTGFDRHVRAQHDLRNIVKEFDGIGIHGRDPEFHNGAPQDHKDQVGQRNVEGRGKIRQRPSLLWGEERERECKQEQVRTMFEYMRCIPNFPGAHWSTQSAGYHL